MFSSKMTKNEVQSPQQTYIYGFCGINFFQKSPARPMPAREKTKSVFRRRALSNPLATAKENQEPFTRQNDPPDGGLDQLRQDLSAAQLLIEQLRDQVAALAERPDRAVWLEAREELERERARRVEIEQELRRAQERLSRIDTGMSQDEIPCCGNADPGKEPEKAMIDLFMRFVGRK